MSPNSYQADLPETEAQLFELSSFPVLSIDEGLKFTGNKEFLTEMLKLSIEKALPEDIAEIKVAHDEGDWDKIQQLAHKIKSGVVYIGLIRLKMACQYLERYWKVGERNVLEKLYQQLLIVHEETSQLIERWIKLNK
jgi:HPt (histidine-containing phosphotransfer) domain-containing protein